MIRRNTPSKEAVLQLLTKATSALSQDMLEEQLTGKMDRVTIYRILNRFCEDGVAHKIVADDGKSYFALCHQCNHNERHTHEHVHFKCTVCGELECLEESIDVHLPKGYKAQSAHFLINGVCSQCAN